MNEPKPKGVLTAPKTLSKAAKAHWTRIAFSMDDGVFAPPDEGLLAAWCEARANHDEATFHLKTNPLVVPGSTGQATVSPWLKIQSDMTRLMISLAQQLGFNPAARAKLHAPVSDDEDTGGLTFN
ncbi:phage terminase small subunit P27 family [Brevundimonas sp. M1A4_2e]